MAKSEYFSSRSSSVKSERVLYTPSVFARTSLLHLQEAGSLQALKPHSSSRSGLLSYLCFAVMSGSGELLYDGKVYELKKGDVVFIDCRKDYSHYTSDDLWSLRWCHFYGASMQSIYEKYRERGGQPVFHPVGFDSVTELLSQLYVLANSPDYIRDMRINQTLSCLLTLLMEDSWDPENSLASKKRMELGSVRAYIDEHYTEKITLDGLASVFYINKFYLSKIFKETYGMTIIAYVEQKRITKAKSLLRFSDKTVDEIGYEVGMSDANYFSRLFKKIEGITPSQFRKLW